MASHRRPPADPASHRASAIARHLHPQRTPTPLPWSALEPLPCLQYSPHESSSKVATFDTAEMRRLMDGHDVESRDWAYGVIADSPLFWSPVRGPGGRPFLFPDFNQSMEQQREMTLRRIVYLLGSIAAVVGEEERTGALRRLLPYLPPKEAEEEEGGDGRRAPPSLPASRRPAAIARKRRRRRRGRRRPSLPLSAIATAGYPLSTRRERKKKRRRRCRAAAVDLASPLQAAAVPSCHCEQGEGRERIDSLSPGVSLSVDQQCSLSLSLFHVAVRRAWEDRRRRSADVGACCGAEGAGAWRGGRELQGRERERETHMGGQREGEEEKMNSSSHRW